MDKIAFTNLKAEFQKADINKKIEMYINTEGLTTPQYKELLKLYPINELGQLEAALEKIS